MQTEKIRSLNRLEVMLQGHAEFYISSRPATRDEVLGLPLATVMGLINIKALEVRHG